MEDAMTHEDDEAIVARNRREMRAMWIFSAAVVLLILGAMGANMIWGHHPASSTATDMSSQSRTAPPK
jgi:hypothetical protein